MPTRDPLTVALVALLYTLRRRRGRVGLSLNKKHRVRATMESKYAHVAVASTNQTVGDWIGNARRIREVIVEAKSRGVRLLLLPEMCIPGYSLGDRLLRAGTVRRSWDVLMALREETEGIAVAVGLPLLYEGVLFNVMGVLANGELCGLVAKENLATGDVEYENRYFEPWPHERLVRYEGPDGVTAPLGQQMFELADLGTIAFEICEDAWKGIRPGSTYVLAGADILLNPSASWFCIGKHAIRRRMVTQSSQEDHCAYLYASLLGCDATRLIFDGSTFIAVNGQILKEGRRFEFEHDWDLIEQVIDIDEIRHIRMEEGSWREQHARMQTGTYGSRPTCIKVPGTFATSKRPAPPAPYWVPLLEGHPDPSLAHHEQRGLRGHSIKAQDINHLELELSIALALRDYQRKTHVPGFCLALSGGRDSAMVALLVHRMFRHQFPGLSDEALREKVREHFICAYMATENSGPQTQSAARQVANEVGALFYDGQIQGALQAATETVERMTGDEFSWSNPAHDVPLQNIQARLRGMLIWTVANLHNYLLLVTSNKSEAAVGYTTMDGDTSGGLAPIADVPKSLVSLWLDWAGRTYDYPGLNAILAMQASAELRPPERAQTDEDDLMPFFILDQLMYLFVQLALDPTQIFCRLWPSVFEHYHGRIRPFAEDIRRFVRMFCFAQWKRERFAISFRVTAFDLDPKAGFRFPAVQEPFTQELLELVAFVERVEAREEVLEPSPIFSPQ